MSTQTKAMATKPPLGEWEEYVLGKDEEGADVLARRYRGTDGNVFLVHEGVASQLEPVATFHLHPDNPRRGDLPVLRGSLNYHGQYKAIVANKGTYSKRYPPGTVGAGNHTLRSALEEGWTHIGVTWVDVSDDELDDILLIDNRSGDLAYYDEAVLAEVLKRRRESKGTGFSAEFVADLLSSMATGETEELTDPDEVPPAPPKPVSGLGDLWILGEHRLLCGDATSREDVARLMAGELASVLWTDPPYGVSYVGKTEHALTIAGDAQEEAVALFADALSAADEVLRPGSPFYIAHPAGALSVAFGSVVLDLGWRLHQTLVWVKDSMVVGHADYHYKHEPILYGYKPGEGRFGRGGKGWYGGHSETSVLEVPRPLASREHPTAKPVRLVERCLVNSSRRGALVYEPFGGSGSTLVAAHRTGRRCHVMELEPRYVDVVCRRYQRLTGTRPVLEATGEPHDFAGDAAAA